MLEINEANVLAYLREQDRLPAGIAHVEVLAGGVSNIVLRIGSPEQSFVLKQSRPQLRTRDPWFSDLARVYREQEVMQVLGPLLPAGTVPKVLFVDRDNFAFAMTSAPLDAIPWKQRLLAGDVDLALGERAGHWLGIMHEVTARNPQLVAPFRHHHVFVQLRADPFYQRVRERRPEVADIVAGIIDEMLACQDALCHGDYTPKNMLVHDAGFTLVDYETACQGDPAMDLGLFLTHLILKAVRLPQQREAIFDLTRRFWQGYAAEITFRPLPEMVARGLRHLGVCLLARVDGTSPVDYLPEEEKRAAVRRMGIGLLRDNIKHWDELLSLCERELAPI